MLVRVCVQPRFEVLRREAAKAAAEAGLARLSGGLLRVGRRQVGFTGAAWLTPTLKGISLTHV